jgi:hypothetical protein
LLPIAADFIAGTREHRVSNFMNWIMRATRWGSRGSDQGYKLERAGTNGADMRLTTSDVLSPVQFHTLASELGVQPLRVRKVGYVSARPATHVQTVQTLWNGKETVGQANVGDFIVANLDRDKNVLRDKDGNANIYVIAADRFGELYGRDAGDTAYGDVYKARAAVEAIYFARGFEIMAPWGELQRAASGYLMCNGKDVYGNHKDTFDATYEPV